MTFAEYVRRERRVEVEWHAASMTLRVRINRADGTMRAIAVTDLRLVESRLSPVDLIAREVHGNPLDVAAIRLLAKDELHAKLGTVPGMRTALLRQPREPVFLGVDVGTGDRSVVAIRERAVRGFDRVDRAFAGVDESAVAAAATFCRLAGEINQAVEDALPGQPTRHRNTLRTWRGINVPDGTAAPPEPLDEWRHADGRPDWQGIMNAINAGRLGMSDAARIVEQLSPERAAPMRVRPSVRAVEQPPSDAPPLAPVNRKLPFYKPR